ncbi:MAG TPA: acyl carrier protein [Acidimicrobiales bacterium]|nr:acyl carrier protein [Acidimicrobiales bacterium]
MTSISGSTETATTQTGGTTGEIAQRVRAFLVDTFLLGDDDGFATDVSLLDSGIVDSTGVMEVVAFLEESFGIVVDDDELVADNLDSVERLAAFVARKRT